MLKTFQILAATVILLSSCSSFALDQTSAIPDDELEFLNAILAELSIDKISAEHKTDIHDIYSDALSEGWYVNWFGNNDLKSSNMEGNDVKVLDFVIANYNRIYSISMTYFPNEKQIFYVTRQFVSGDAEAVLGVFEETKKNEESEILEENDTYAMTTLTGYLDYDIYHVDSEVGSIAYISAGIVGLE